ncbi:LacI family DNA-binding transcriptional regulator [Celeribacter sp.]|uniref:LacI family DNA-binding transcriptional regulator n=1 Tax=Celeribacter sp. TaxID=1890673 RepID=UPI003A8EA24B
MKKPNSDPVPEIMRKSTLEDVARLAGVSKMTASRALRNAGDVSRANVIKVQAAAEQIGYVGNNLALSLSAQSTNLIGVVIPGLSNIVFAEVLSGIADAIDGTDLQSVFGVTDYDPEKEYQTILNMLSWRPAGLIVTGLDQPEKTRKLLEAADIPIVQIMDLDGDPVDAVVGLSHKKAGADMARALLDSGRRRFGYVGCRLHRDTRAAKRYAGFVEALAAQGHVLRCEALSEAPSTVHEGRRLTAEILETDPDLDCLYFSNDDVAMGGVFHCMARAISVPDQIMLAGFNGLDFVDSLPIKIATSRTDRRQIGRRAIGIISSGKGPKGVGSRMIDLPAFIDLGQ